MKPLVVALLLSAPVAFASETAAPALSAASPQKGFWKVLVKPNARWVLPNTITKDPKDTLVVETYDVRKVRDADVARPRVTHTTKDGKTDATNQLPFSQVALTEAGIYLLNALDDDAAVLAALKHKPSRSNPPREYGPTSRNSGRYLSFERRGVSTLVCTGYQPLPDAGECEDTCFGSVCISAEEGVVKVDGTYAPDNDAFEAAKGGRP
jgi:hypothetical protein